MREGEREREMSPSPCDTFFARRTQREAHLLDAEPGRRLSGASGAARQVAR